LTGNTLISGNYNLNICNGAKINTDAGYQISGVTMFSSAKSLGNIAIGCLALKSVTTGVNNVGIGYQSLYCSQNGCNNFAVGSNALRTNCGSNNIANGYYAMLNNSTGCNNIGNGCRALNYNQTGCNNIGIGSGSICGNYAGCNSVAIGHQSLLGKLYISHSNNIGIGYQTLYNNTTGCHNIASGCLALTCNGSGNSNIAIGVAAGYCTTGNTSVFLGNQAGCFEKTGSKLYIENSGANCSNALIYGEFDNDILKLNACTYIKTVGNGACTDSMLTWDSSTCAIRKMPYSTGGTSGGDKNNVYSYTAVTSNVTLNTISPYVILGDSTGGAFTITLPPTPLDGQVFKIKNSICID